MQKKQAEAQKGSHPEVIEEEDFEGGQLFTEKYLPKSYDELLSEE
jgi:hypothetical protein